MKTIYLDDFLDNGIIKEKSFRKKISTINWDSYNAEKVLIKGCATAPVPTWAFMIITAHLSKHVNSILFGEPCSTIRIFDNTANN